MLGKLWNSIMNSTTPIPLASQTGNKPLPVAKPVAVYQKPVQDNTPTQIYNAKRETKPLWEEHKRIKRFRLLALQGGHSISQVEGVKLNGAWCQKALEVYDKGDTTTCYRIESIPIEQLVSIISGMIQQGF